MMKRNVIRLFIFGVGLLFCNEALGARRSGPGPTRGAGRRGPRPTRAGVMKRMRGRHEAIRIGREKKMQRDASRAVRRGDIKELQELLDRGFNINSRGKDGLTVLGMAITAGNIKIIEKLLTVKRINVNTKGYARPHRPGYRLSARGSMTALALAIRHRNIKIIEKLLTIEGIDVNSVSTDTKASRLDRSALTALMLAIKLGHTSIVKMLLAAKEINVNLKSGPRRGYSPGGYRGLTPLIMAVELGRANIVKILLAAKGINVNLRGKQEGLTALMLAVKLGHANIVKMLLAAKGINVNLKISERTKHYYGWSALKFAIRSRHGNVMNRVIIMTILRAAGAK